MSLTLTGAGPSGAGGAAVLTAPTFRAAGAHNAGALTASPGLPAGTVQNDVLIAVVSCTGNAATTVGGGGTWTLRGAVNLSGTRRLEFHESRFNTGEAAPTFTIAASNVCHAVILGWSGCKTSGSAIDQISASASGSVATVDFNDGTPTVANTEYVMIRGGQGVANMSGYSGANPAPTERFDSLAATGSGSGIQVASGTKNDTTAWGARTATLSSAQAWGSFAFNLIGV